MPLPASNSFNSLIINSDAIQAERSILFCGMYLNFTTLTQKWRKLASSKQCRKDGNIMCCNHTLAVGFIKFSPFAHSQAYYTRTHKKVCISTHKDRGEKSMNTPQTRSYTCYQHPFLALFSVCLSLWWDRGCHAVTVRGRRTNKCFPLRRCDLNGKATWQLCSERPHNQTPHPLLHTTTCVWESFHPLFHVQYNLLSASAPKILHLVLNVFLSSYFSCTFSVVISICSSLHYSPGMFLCVLKLDFQSSLRSSVIYAVHSSFIIAQCHSCYFHQC